MPAPLVVVAVVLVVLLVQAVALAAVARAEPSTPAQVTAGGFLRAPAPTPLPSAGRTAGTSRTGQAVHTVVGLGDSVPAGTACDCVPYLDLVASALAQGESTRVEASNLAVAGQTSQDLLDALGTADVGHGIRGADLVVVTIGANDFDDSVAADADCASAACYTDTLRALDARLDQILARVHALAAGHQTRVVVTGYWNVFLDGSVGRQQGDAYVGNSDALTRAANATIEQVAARNQATYVDLYAPFKGDGSRDDSDLLADDGDHPSAQGHRVIAAAVTSAVTASAGTPRS